MSLRFFLSILFTFCFLVPIHVFAFIPDLPEKEIVKRVYAHLLIDDMSASLEEAQQGISLYPNSKPLLEARIKILARSGDEKEMLLAWNHLLESFPEEQANHEIIESMAWGVIDQGFRSSSPITRIFAMLGAFFAQDAKSTVILSKGLKDQNTIVRGAAIQLASKMRDAKLQKDVLNILKNEKNWPVRLEAIKAIGSMKISEAQPYLIDILANNRSSTEEKSAAIESLVNLKETADRQEVAVLSRSDRAGLRLLAIQVVSHFDLIKEIDLIMPLLKDTRAEVRAAAIEALGILRIADYEGRPIGEFAFDLLEDPDESVAITAAWTMCLNDPAKGQQALERWLRSENKETRLIAAAALNAAGAYGFPLALKIFNEEKDNYVRANLALGLITQRIEADKACDALYVVRTRKAAAGCGMKMAFSASLPPAI